MKSYSFQVPGQMHPRTASPDQIAKDGCRNAPSCGGEEESREKSDSADPGKDAFLGMLAHELRNTLAPIRWSAEMLHCREATDEERADAREMIERQIGVLARLTDDVLDLMRCAKRTMPLRRELIDLRVAARDAAKDIRDDAEKAGLRLSVAVPTEPVWIEGDRVRIGQVLGNLLVNAVKYTERGEITLDLVRVPVESKAVIKVADTGLGMDPTTLAHVFEPFTQAERSIARSRGGLGLGLALVKCLVEFHHGTIEAASPGPGLGSSFTVQLPLASGPIPSQN